MKKRVNSPAIISLVFAAILLIAAIFGLAFSSKTAYATSYEPYSFEIKRYDVQYDINSDRSMHVKEDIYIHFTGYNSTGFYRDIPINGGESVKGAKVTYINRVENDDLDTVKMQYSPVYDVTMEESGFVTLDIGDTSRKTNETFAFGIEYDYILNKVKKSEKNAIFINPVGFGWECKIEEANITLNLPDGATGATYYYGSRYNNAANAAEIVDGTVKAQVLELRKFEGVTFDLTFNEGVLSKYFEMTPYWFVIAGAVILLVLILVKLLVFNKNTLTPVVNFEAPEEMDPLLMGKLIDNKVNPEDLSSLIFYWADKGYLKIDLTNENDPVFIRIHRSLPAMAPGWQHVYYNAIFRQGDIVRAGSLSGSIGGAVKSATDQVNSAAKGLYTPVSLGVAIIFALLGCAIMMVSPIISAMLTISATVFFIYPLFMVVPALIIFGLTESVMYYRLKLKKGRALLYLLGISALAALCGLFYTLLVPGAVFPTLPKILLCVVGFLIVMTSVTLISRTSGYTQKLNQIVGFRNFILLAEKSRLEALLEENPEFYYHILPYAHVLNVSDKWEEKFKDISIPPPQWATSPAGTYLTFHAINHSLRRVSTQVRPVSPTASAHGSGLSGSGGGFGGHAGGGHGGGGGRGR